MACLSFRELLQRVHRASFVPRKIIVSFWDHHDQKRVSIGHQTNSSEYSKTNHCFFRPRFPMNTFVTANIAEIWRHSIPTTSTVSHGKPMGFPHVETGSIAKDLHMSKKTRGGLLPTTMSTHLSLVPSHEGDSNRHGPKA